MQLLSETFLILRKIQPDTINAHTSAHKVPVILVIFIRSINFLERFSKNPQIFNFMKKTVGPVGAELFHTDMRKDGRTYIR